MPFCDRERLIDRLVEDLGSLVGKRVLELNAKDDGFAAELAYRGADIRVVIDDRRAAAYPTEGLPLHRSGLAIIRHDPEAWLAQTDAFYDLMVVYRCGIFPGGTMAKSFCRLLSRSDAMLVMRRDEDGSSIRVEECQSGYDRICDDASERAVRDYIVDRGFRIVPLDPDAAIAGGGCDGAILCLRCPPSL